MEATRCCIGPGLMENRCGLIGPKFGTLGARRRFGCWGTRRCTAGTANDRYRRISPIGLRVAVLLKLPISAIHRVAARVA